MRRTETVLYGLLLLALLLRLAAGLAQDPALAYHGRSSDATWYLANGYALASGFDEGYLPGYASQQYPEGYPIRLRSLPTPPVYLLFVGIPQTLISPTGAVIAIRILQALLGTVAVYLAYRLARTLSGSSGVGLIAAGVLAVSPAFVMESGQITTETVYIFLVTAALAVYVEHLRDSWGWLALAALLLGMATLTRALLLLFPLGLVLHLLLVYGLRAGFKRVVVLLGVYTLVVGSWTAYNLARWDRWVIGGEGFAAFLYLGATESGWQGPDATDAALAQSGDLPPETSDQQDVYLENAQALIRSDPLGYAQRRVSQLADALIQPHGTLLFGGASVRDLLADWLREDRSLAGLSALMQAPGFWQKLGLYIFHYVGLGFGIVGLWMSRSRWRLSLPLAGFILYTILIHLVLDAIPRYLFPTQVFWWVYASLPLALLVRSWRGRKPAVDPTKGEADARYNHS